MLQRHILPPWQSVKAEAIPWAEPSAEAPVVYPSYLNPKTHRSSFKTRAIFAIPVNVYPQNFGEWPANKPPVTHKVDFKVKWHKAPDPNLYPATPSANDDHPASLTLVTNKTSFKTVSIEPQELNVYPETPAAYYEGYYPGSKQAKTYTWEYKTELRQPLELDQFTPTPIPEQPVTAFIPPITRQMGFDVTWIGAIPLNFVDAAVVVVVPPTPTGAILRFGADDRNLVFAREDRTMSIPRHDREA
ncbi:MAG: hypothetical protein V3U84_11035 [Thiotrichaceae bacterium]